MDQLNTSVPNDIWKATEGNTIFPNDVFMYVVIVPYAESIWIPHAHLQLTNEKYGKKQL